MNLERSVVNRKSYRDYTIYAIIAFALGLLINKFFIVRMFVPSVSMAPTLLIGDKIIGTRVYNPNNLRRGDVVGFHSKEFDENMLKRLIGLPGDKIKITEEGEVFINGSKLDENYVVFQDSLSGEFEVPEGKFFFLGDNRLESDDSRLWSNPYIDFTDIISKARFIVFPLDKFGRVL